MSYTGFVNAIDIEHDLDRVREHLAFSPDERPVVFQIFDHDEDRILRAARIIDALQPDAIDVNMGCPDRRVSGRGAGAGLLRQPEKAGRIIRSLTTSLNLPVSAKVRIGWDEDTMNHLEISRIIEDNGAALIAVHGRTRSQGYSVPANWDAIAAIKAAVSIPVIGNGDVRGVEDIAAMKEHTRCDAVMIGRAAVGNPWIFKYSSRENTPAVEVVHVILDHLSRMCSFYGEGRGVMLFRKHLSQYLKRFPLHTPDRRVLLTCADASHLAGLIEHLALREDHDGSHDSSHPSLADM
jgi:tRNA-dihydrouridine synthase B